MFSAAFFLLVREWPAYLPCCLPGPRLLLGSAVPSLPVGKRLCPTGATSPKVLGVISPVSSYLRRNSSLTKNIHIQKPSRAMSS